MRAVSRFEANLLLLLRFFLRRVPAEQAAPLLFRAHEPPPCLGRDAVALVQDSLAKGCVLLLARTGGWRQTRHTRGDRVSGGRLWERTPPTELGLNFSRHALNFLIRATALALPPGKPLVQPAPEQLTVGDWLLFYYAYGALRAVELNFKERTAFIGPLIEQAVFLRNPLCRLAYAGDFAEGKGGSAPEFAPWVNGVGACVLEALQPELEDHWVRTELNKGTVLLDPSRVRRLGQTQAQVLDAFFIAVEAEGRQDLARFLLNAAVELLAGRSAPYGWVRDLSVTPLRLADRVEVYRSALAFPRALDRLQGWERQARSVGYFDEGYAAAQQWKDDWERAQGDQLVATSHQLVRRFEPLP